ncbi:hypothetical protein [Cecembia lonarensis]|uniref:Uncharacterized protein n=1 Tax=Cecembia lonarensis (strain CCUG 58316 / KCTC 22772 / LW9) TaxID=1225176 RepID=K1L820_CECL9|nr:hypothetical protein [Cecembia lonarensis]EKB48242.1 hypothetical protein B879_03136 [Cecembia lonarensis LW9]
MIQRLSFSLLILLLIFTSCVKEKAMLELQTDQLTFSLDQKGNIISLMDKKSQKNYLYKAAPSPLLQVKSGGDYLLPLAAKLEGGQLVLGFPKNIELTLQYEEKASHLTFEITAAKGFEEIELIAWGPIPTIINKIIGETVGVVRGEEFAIGIQALNPKTLGGFPWLNNDTTPQFDIFEQEDYSDLSEENKRETLYRVEAAKPEDFGSTLQAYTRNRLKERTVSNLNHDYFISPIFEDGGIIGSKIAIFGSAVEEALEHIGKIEVEEGLPHPQLNGLWAKLSKEAASAYLIYDFTEANIDQAIAYTLKAGLKYLYHSDPFKNWGHFELKASDFPNGWDGLKACVEKAAQAGIHVGVHTLSNFITTNDPYVTPVPDPRLGIVGYGFLEDAIDGEQKEIPISTPEFFDQFKNNSLKTVMIGSELIRYGSVSSEAPWKLLDCERGAWDTQRSSHTVGTQVSKLADHAYKVFLSNTEMSIEIAQTLADLYNYAGLRQISFDGLEGNRSTGMGNYGEILFTTTWWKHLNEDIRSHLITDASRTTHYFWHIYSRMNWGEPWYAGFRESQTEYRLKNQAYFQRNMMPGMLGWFSMRNNTPIEDIEWMLARSAAFDAGYAFVVRDEALQSNGQLETIFQSIADWEKVRMSGILTEGQKEKMKDINNEFQLIETGKDQWNLHQVHVKRFEHQAKVLQPGEPLYTSFTFENSVEDALLHFIITVEASGISAIELELNNRFSLQFPLRLNKGESIRYSGGTTAQVLDQNLRQKAQIPIDPALLTLKSGSQQLNIDCTFHDPEELAKVKVELRILDKAERINIAN